MRLKTLITRFFQWYFPMRQRVKKTKKRLPPNWRKRIEIIEKRTSYMWEFTIQFKQNQTPKGFYRYIGNLTVDQLDNSFIVAEAFLEEKFRGRGLGKMLYLHAIHKLGQLGTYYHSATKDAQGVWKSLIKNLPYETDFWKNQLTVFANQKPSTKWTHEHIDPTYRPRSP